MAKTIDIGGGNYDFTIAKSDKTYRLAGNDVIASAQILTDAAGNIDDIVLEIAGTVTDGVEGLIIGAANSSRNTITIERSGVLDIREQAIIATGNRTEITNLGTIFVWDSATSIGIRSTGNDGKIVNDGFLKAEIGFEISGDGNAVVNSGLLSGYPGTIGLIFDTTTGDTNRFENTGTMRGGSAIQAGDGDESIINRGNMHGSVELGAGDDLFRTYKSVLGDIRLGDGADRLVIKDRGDSTGFDAGSGNDILDLREGDHLSTSTTISGGADDDTYLVTRNDLVLQENGGGGTDTVSSTRSFTLDAEFENLELTGDKAIDGTGNAKANIITGNDRKNDISGLIGADTLDGAKGDDVLTGGANIDTFVFGHRTGTDTVTDYVDGTDKIDLSTYNHGINAFSDLDGRIEQKGTSAVIRLEDGDRIILQNTDSTNLEATDFQF